MSKNKLKEKSQKLIARSKKHQGAANKKALLKKLDQKFKHRKELRETLADLVDGKGKSSRRITLSEAKSLYAELVGDDSSSGKSVKGVIDKDEYRLLKYAIGYDNTTDSARRYLARSLVKRQSKRKRDNLRVASKPVRTACLNALLEKSSYPPNGFSLWHRNGGYFAYTIGKYHLIREQVVEGDIELFEYKNNQDEVVAKKVLGTYRSTDEQLYVATNRSRKRWMSTLIHEATHAVQDIYNVGGWTHDREVAAHVAQAIYLLQNGGGLYGRLDNAGIMDLAISILASNGHYKINKKERLAAEEELKNAYPNNVAKDTDPFDNFLDWFSRL